MSSARNKKLAADIAAPNTWVVMVLPLARKELYIASAAVTSPPGELISTWMTLKSAGSPAGDGNQVAFGQHNMQIYIFKFKCAACQKTWNSNAPKTRIPTGLDALRIVMWLQMETN
nr:hypothetical protein [uncultured Albidiferax sp.]